MDGRVDRVAARRRGRARAVATPCGALDASRRVKRRRVVAAQRRDLDHITGMGRMDELAAADVDALVARSGEEDEVAGLELADGDGGAHRRLRVRAVRQRDADL